LTQLSNAFAPLLVASPESGPPGSPNISARALGRTPGSLLFSPDIRPFEITLEAHELVDVLDANGRVAGDNDAGPDALGHDAAVVADHVVLADESAVPAVEPIADDGSCIDDRARADHAAGADHSLQLARLLAARRLADDCAFVHIRALADADVGVDHAIPSR